MLRLSLLLFAVLGWLQYSLWFGKNNINDYMRISVEVAAQRAENEKLRLRNERMFAEIDDLNNGSEAIEERARNELGMIKPNEVFYRIISKSTPNNRQ